ncbi:MAG: hypothetical protein WD749_06885 [Phycisphaerales bacterium]
MRERGIEVKRFQASEFPRNRFGVRDTIRGLVEARVRAITGEEAR